MRAAMLKDLKRITVFDHDANFVEEDATLSDADVNSSCAAEYENIIASIEANSEFRKPAFNDPSMVVAINILVTAALLMMALICKVWTQNPSASLDQKN